MTTLARSPQSLSAHHNTNGTPRVHGNVPDGRSGPTAIARGGSIDAIRSHTCRARPRMLRAACFLAPQVVGFCCGLARLRGRLFWRWTYRRNCEHSFTNIEGSTALWARDAKSVSASLLVHDEVLRVSIESRGGSYAFTTAGEAFFAAFQRSSDAVAAVKDAQD